MTTSETQQNWTIDSSRKKDIPFSLLKFLEGFSWFDEGERNFDVSVWMILKLKVLKKR